MFSKEPEERVGFIVFVVFIVKLLRNYNEIILKIIWKEVQLQDKPKFIKGITFDLSKQIIEYIVICHILSNNERLNSSKSTFGVENYDDCRLPENIGAVYEECSP